MHSSSYLELHLAGFSDGCHVLIGYRPQENLRMSKSIPNPPKQLRCMAPASVV